MSNAERKTHGRPLETAKNGRVARLTVSATEAASERALAARIVKTPNICGGSARVNGTRIPVWGIEVSRRAGASAASIVRSYGGLRTADIQAAFAYADRHRAEIDLEIKANEEALAFP
jgi:uncharacterized protein (DUF433 family)